MQTRRKIFVLIILIWANFVAWSICIANNANSAETQIIFLNVGQGDSMLIQQGVKQILIDGGPSKNIISKLKNIMPINDKTIDIIILTHPDSDHSTGLLQALKYYKVKLVLETGIQHQTNTYKQWRKTIKQKGIQRKIAIKGQKITFNKSTQLTILYPFQSLNNKSIKNSNDASIVSRLVTKKYTYLLTGDISSKIENQLMYQNIQMKSDILKLAHHGSKYSTSLHFLQYVNPRAVVISVGKNNPYHHPSKEVLSRLQKMQIHQIFRTDINGDIVF